MEEDVQDSCPRAEMRRVLAQAPAPTPPPWHCPPGQGALTPGQCQNGLQMPSHSGQPPAPINAE